MTAETLLRPLVNKLREPGLVLATGSYMDFKGNCCAVGHWIVLNRVPPYGQDLPANDGLGPLRALPLIYPTDPSFSQLLYRDNNPEWNLVSLLVYLNDHYQWPAAKIADFLETAYLTEKQP